MWAVLVFLKPAKAGGLVDGILLFRHGRHHIVTLPAIDNLPVRHREPERFFDLCCCQEETYDSQWYLILKYNRAKVLFMNMFCDLRLQLI